LNCGLLFDENKLGVHFFLANSSSIDIQHTLILMQKRGDPRTPERKRNGERSRSPKRYIDTKPRPKPKPKPKPSIKYKTRSKNTKPDPDPTLYMDYILDGNYVNDIFSHSKCYIVLSPSSIIDYDPNQPLGPAPDTQPAFVTLWFFHEPLNKERTLLAARTVMENQRIDVWPLKVSYTDQPPPDFLMPKFRYERAKHELNQMGDDISDELLDELMDKVAETAKVFDERAMYVELNNMGQKANPHIKFAKTPEAGKS